MSETVNTKASPQRIQRKFAKGWKMPQGAKFVGAGSQWDNPFKVGESKILLNSEGDRVIFHSASPHEAVENFKLIVANRDMVTQIRRELSGRDLVCWCAVESEQAEAVPCHADVLLAIANSTGDTLTF